MDQEGITGTPPSNPEQGDGAHPAVDAPSESLFTGTVNRQVQAQNPGEPRQQGRQGRQPRQGKQPANDFDALKSTLQKQVAAAEAERDRARAEAAQVKQQTEYSQQLGQVYSQFYAYYQAQFPQETDDWHKKWADHYARQIVAPQQELATYKQKEQAEQAQARQTQLQARRNKVAQDTIQAYRLTVPEFEQIAAGIDPSQEGWEHELHLAAISVAAAKASGTEYDQRQQQRNATPFLAGAATSAASPQIVPPEIPLGDPRAKPYLLAELRRRRTQQG